MFGQWMGISWIVLSLAATGGSPPCVPTVQPTAPAPAPPIAERIGPCIIAFDQAIVPTLEMLWHRSETYQKQCRYLAEKRAVVSVVMQTTRIEHGHRAISSIGRLSDGRIAVRSRIGRSGPAAELVAHELEHAVEFAEGLDFKREVLRGGGFVTYGGTFETARADRAGRRAGAEVKGWRPSARTAPADAVPRCTT
jgi:hypothetical protein